MNLHKHHHPGFNLVRMQLVPSRLDGHDYVRQPHAIRNNVVNLESKLDHTQARAWYSSREMQTADVLPHLSALLVAP